MFAYSLNELNICENPSDIKEGIQNFNLVTLTFYIEL